MTKLLINLSLSALKANALGEYFFAGLGLELKYNINLEPLCCAKIR